MGLEWVVGAGLGGAGVGGLYCGYVGAWVIYRRGEYEGKEHLTSHPRFNL